MGIFKRIKTIARADINSLLDSMENPIAMLNEYTREMEQELSKAQSALSRQIFVEKKQAALISQTKELVEKRVRQAKLALEKGDEGIAKLAVQEKINLETQLNLYEQQLITLKEQTNILKEKFNELQVTYNELQHKKILLASRANAAKSIKQIQKVTIDFNGETITKGITRAEERILFMEAEVQAGSYTSNPLNSYNKISFSNVSDEEIAKELDKLKADKEAI
ncbi:MULTISPECIES: PspA/IM30 family protein [unclassified Niallia]|uniref:PspA/IM30 family protein n=1 Tax=unclassified Niallia TaxID=2837522 RepID=UPI001EDBF873|nr:MULTISPECIES: PspA/IM30 family protein [unclassified Niallia]MCM3031619.1 PspA/IM30 family protein [Niallia sp. MER 6]UPO89860.1 PspA/IM30 family protein [Niallia sp. Man26]